MIDLKRSKRKWRNARTFSRLVDDVRHTGSITEGIKLENGGTLAFSVGSHIKMDKNSPIDLSTNDNRILATALWLKSQGKQVIVISKDINLRLKADVLGIEAEDYGMKDVSLDELYSGQSVVDVPAASLQEFESERFLDLPDATERGIFPNEYLIIQEEGNDRRRMLGRYSEMKKGIVPLIPIREGVWGIYPKNMEQQFALDALS